MISFSRNELVIIRHAPADHGGRLCGRTDVAACLPDASTFAPVRALFSELSAVSSPARRCRETAEVLFGRTLNEEPRLWEQDFGILDGAPFSDLPDLGEMDLASLARHRSDGGESFLDMMRRLEPAFLEFSQQVQSHGPMALIAHAGTARAALGLALGDPKMGLKFEIAPLSMTRLRCIGRAFSIVSANERLVG